MNLVNLLFSFRGRINRRRYWLGNAAVTIGGILIVYLLAFLAGAPMTAVTGKSSEALAGLGSLGLIVGLVMLIMSWCGFALQVKRFHDRGRSGYWALAPFVPVTMIVMNTASGVATDAPGGAVVADILPWLGVSLLINLWFFIDLGLLPGTNGPNKYDNTPAVPPPGSPTKNPAASIFGNAEKAIERAIAEQARLPVHAPASPPLSAPASTGFGRRPAR